jgi:GT2 family glycosyltransferase
MTVTILQATLAFIGLLLAYDVCQQSTMVWRLLRYLHQERAATQHCDEGPLPKSAVILSLRGPDPHLKDTLRALVAQDYPDFHVRIVVDNEQDPVLEDVIDIQNASEDGRISVSVLKDPSASCSLKCSSLIQAVRELDADVEIVAFIDGDAVPHNTWLKDLVRPLANGEADVSGGNRWYLPPNFGLGSMARYFWNIPFMTGMWAQGAPWAGTMAFHRKTADRIGLLDEWSTAMSVDATLHRCMRTHGLRFKLVESLIMPNREDISLPDFQSWVARQMAVVRFTVAASVRVVRVQIGILGVAHTLLPAAAVTAFAVHQNGLGFLAMGLLLAYWLICCFRAMLIERSMRVSLKRRGERTRWIRPVTILLWCPCLVVAHYVVGTGIFIALRLKQLDWRGIRYRLSGNGVVSMTEYRPYRAKWIRTDNQSIV